MRSSLILACFMLLVAACKSTSADAPMLVGKVVTDSPANVIFMYDHNGDRYIDEITTDSLGNFSYNPELPVEAVDLTIYCGNSSYGARIAQGHTVEMTIDNGEADFSGDNVAEAEFLTAYNQAYEYLKFKPRPQQPYVYDSYMAMLNDGNSAAEAALEKIADDDLRAYYDILNRTKYTGTLLNVYQCDRAINSVDHDAVIDSLLDAIDPEADVTRIAGLLDTWMYYRGPRVEHGNDMRESAVNQIRSIDSVLVNEANKKSLWESSAQLYMMFEDSVEALNDFMTMIEPQLAQAPKMAERFREIISAKGNKVTDGCPIPSDPVLIAPDGSKCSLSSLLGDKIVYIDLWATWCAPCCKEIPFLDKVVEHYKGNDKIAFVSISCDQDTEAWLNKLDADKPQWPQYVFDDVTGKTFMDAMNANSIPRFFIIGRDSCFISVAAQRPSDTALIATIDKAIAAD